MFLRNGNNVTYILNRFTRMVPVDPPHSLLYYHLNYLNSTAIIINGKCLIFPLACYLSEDGNRTIIRKIVIFRISIFYNFETYILDNLQREFHINNYIY